MNLSQYRFPADQSLRLAAFSTDDKNSFSDQHAAEGSLRKGVERLAELQDILYAQDQRALLIIFQALDGAGKDSTIKHVMSGINPQGCQVTSFKSPSAEELDHAYLWRCMKVTPAKGDIGIFNRSYYEEVLVTRVHPELLTAQKLPMDYSQTPPDHSFWLQRYRDIQNFEEYLMNNGTTILKFFLHVSKGEQKKRFLKRIEDPAKNWKFSDRDVEERKYWDDYHYAYEQTFLHTSTERAPWYIIPADHKWFMQLLVCEIIIDSLEKLELKYPAMSGAQKEKLERGKQLLLDE